MDQGRARARSREVRRRRLAEGIIGVARAVVDLFAVLAAFALAWSLYGWLIGAGWIPAGPPPFMPYVTIALVFGGLSLAVFQHLGLYRRSASVLNLAELQTAVQGIALAAAYLFALLFFLKLRGYSRIAIVVATVTAAMLVVLERRLVSTMLSRLQLCGRLGWRVVICGSGATARLIMKKIVQAPHIGYYVVGFLDDTLPIGRLISCRIAQMGPVLFQAPVLGRWRDWRDVVVQYSIDDILMAGPVATPDRLRELVQVTADGRPRVGVVPQLEAIRPDQLQVDDLSAIPILRPYAVSSTRLYDAAKRLMDLIIGTTLAFLTAPLWLAAIVLIALESPGPVFFVQERIGLNGQRFRMFKFRTMRRDAAKYAPSPHGDIDPRITRVGRLLRTTGLDELPQLINVLRGEMSLVGPRPEMPFIVDRYSPLERQRLRAKPGITGLWQLSADRHAEIHENIEYDLYYIDHRSLMMDVLILLETVFFTIGLVLSVPRRRSTEDYRPATIASYRHDGDGPYVLLALDQRSDPSTSMHWRTLAPAAYTLADRWPIKLLATDSNVAALERTLGESMRRLGSYDYRAEYVSCRNADELRALVAGASMVITDLSHVATMAANAGVDHLTIEREGVRTSIRTRTAREIIDALGPLFPPTRRQDAPAPQRGRQTVYGVEHHDEHERTAR
jgi:exopolysaccharide biosynthesis polyprenyl glycosylphosphotransferase